MLVVKRRRNLPLAAHILLALGVLLVLRLLTGGNLSLFNPWVEGRLTANQYTSGEGIDQALLRIRYGEDSPDPLIQDKFGMVRSVTLPVAVTGQVSTYAIYIENRGAYPVQVEQFGNLLPQGFSYVPGSSGGITSQEPSVRVVNGQQQLVWSLTDPLPYIQAETVVRQFFHVFTHYWD